jgi:hypothetical protein
MQDKPSTPTWIYFLETEDGRFIKIGRSADVIQRLYALQVANPGLKLLGVLPETGTMSESHIHEQFAADHHEGEWFHNSPSIATYIKRLQQVPMPPRKLRNSTSRILKARMRREIAHEMSTLPDAEEPEIFRSIDERLRREDPKFIKAFHNMLAIEFYVELIENTRAKAELLDR